MCGEKVHLFAPSHPCSARSARSLLPPLGGVGGNQQSKALLRRSGSALQGRAFGRDGGSTFQAWARAIHDASTRWDGIRYVSRQMNKGFACAIFERSGLLRLRTEKLKPRQVDELCDRFNVSAV